MTEFEESVRDIEGLTDFKLGKLPEWFSERLKEKLVMPSQDHYSDVELVNDCLSHKWLGRWGTATINDAQALLFEFHWDRAYDQFEPDRLADELDCGLQRVEMSDRFYVDTAFFTEHVNLVPRRKGAGMALAVSQA